MVGPFSTFGDATEWIGQCDVQMVFIHAMIGADDALQRGNAQMEKWKTPFGFQAWSESKESETGRRDHAERKANGEETRRQVSRKG